MNRIDTDELRPCPFCGTTEMLRRVGAAPGEGRSFVRCDYCYAEGPDPEDFPGGWNARAREAELQVRLGEARAAWEAFEGATITDDHHEAVDRMRAALTHPASGEGADHG